jgi:hypothetical protein
VALPRYWIRLPAAVVDAATLAAHLRAREAASGSDPDWPVRVAERTAADLLDVCPPRNAGAMYAVAEALEARREAAGGTAALARAHQGAEVIAWDAVAFAVRRIAEAVDWAALDPAPDIPPELPPALAAWRRTLAAIRAEFPDPETVPPDVAQALSDAWVGVSGASLADLMRGLTDTEAAWITAVWRR